LNSAEQGDPNRLLPPVKVRGLFGIAATTLRDWDASGALRAVQRTKGGHRRYRESDVRSLLAELEAAA
jgi:DNA-binding transcriptional MerR regulator